MKGLVLLGFSLLLFVTVGFTKSVSISGKINNHTYSISSGGIQINTSAKLSYYDILGTFVEEEGLVTNSGTYSFSFFLKEPTLAQLTYGPDVLDVFIEPGQRVVINFDAVAIADTKEFSGDGKNANNYFYQADIFYIAELSHLGLSAKDLMSRKLSYFESYIGAYKVSTAFKNWATSEIKYGYANEALLTAASDEEKTKIYVQYNVSNDKAVTSRQYLSYVDNYISRLYFLYGNSEPRWPKYFELTVTNLTGKSRELYLTKVMAKLLSSQNDQSTKFYITYDEIVKNPYYSSLIRRQYSKAAVYYSADVPDNASLNNLQSKSTTISQLLEPYRGKLVYIDFWASWCKPCIDEMNKSRNLKWKHGGQVEVIYISLDNGEKAWRAAIANNKLSGKHFLINKYIRSEASQLFNMFTVPHYVIIDKQGAIVDANAKKPSDPQLTEDIKFFMSY